MCPLPPAGRRLADAKDAERCRDFHEYGALSQTERAPMATAASAIKGDFGRQCSEAISEASTQAPVSRLPSLVDAAPPVEVHSGVDISSTSQIVHAPALYDEDEEPEVYLLDDEDADTAQVLNGRFEGEVVAVPWAVPVTRAA